MLYQTHTSRILPGTRPARNVPAQYIRGRGITLIEMMVALALTTFVILVINQLFNSVVDTVARGTQASELLQKSREMDQQLAFETELEINNDPAVAVNWRSRMVGPKGRDGNGPGGFLAIVQRVVQAPRTVEDGIQGITRFIRSDQLMFVYDQNSGLDAGAKRLPPMAPSSPFSFTGDARDSINAEYVRMWYGHVLQIPEGANPLSYNMSSAASYQAIELGNSAGSGNPNVLAQDWVLGRHALFLSDRTLTPPTQQQPYGPFINRNFAILAVGNVLGPPGSPKLANGVCDVADNTLATLTGVGSGGVFDLAPNILAYQGSALASMFTSSPLLTAAKSEGNSGDMRAWDLSPSHTYFMGGVSDFIVEFAGDLVTGNTNGPATPTNIGADGELDRDADGRIKWYTAASHANANWFPPNFFNSEQPITQPAPVPALYPPNAQAAAAGFNRADAAFVWRHEPPGNDPNNYTDGDFRQWPWMIRIRYRLHDRHGNFQGREITNTATGDKELEPGVWYETLIPVNFQNVK